MSKANSPQLALSCIIPLPAEVEVENEAEDGMIERTNQSGNQWMYTAPACKTNDIVSISAGGFNYDIPFEVYEPTGYNVKDFIVEINTNKCISGFFGAEIYLQLIPTNVSFGAVEVMELGMIATNATPYFLHESRTNWLDHSLCGANVWDKVLDGLQDEVFISELEPPWSDGEGYTWPVPNYWRVIGDATQGKCFCNTDQRFELDGNGTARIKKFGLVFECDTNRYCTVWREE